MDEQAQSPILVVSSRGRHLSPSVGNGYHTLLIKTLSARLYKSGDVFRKALVGQEDACPTNTVVSNPLSWFSVQEYVTRIKNWTY